MPKIDMKLRKSIKQIYDGTPGNLNSFLALSLYLSTPSIMNFMEKSAAQQLASSDIVLKFIKKRWTGTSRQASSRAHSMDEIRRNIFSKINSDNLKTKLSA